MKSHLLKESRAVIVPWVLFSTAALGLLNGPEQYWGAVCYAFSYILAFAVAAAPFVYERQHRTETFLLSQPVPRSTLWLNKIGTTSILPLSGLLLAATLWAYAELNQHRRFAGDDMITANTSYLVVVTVGAWGLGAVTPYFIKQPVSAFLAAALFPWVLVISLLFATEFAHMMGFLAPKVFLGWVVSNSRRGTAAWIVGAVIVTLISLPVSFWRFSRMEIRE